MAMLKDDAKNQMSALFEQTAPQRKRAKRLIREGKPEQAEPDDLRRRAFSVKSGALLGVPESIKGTNDFQPVSFLVDGAAARRSVGRIQVDTAGETDSGTGFLISPHLVMTNQHVLPDAAHAAAAVIVFNDEMDGRGMPVAQSSFVLDPAKFAMFSPENALDFAIVAIGERIRGGDSAADFGYLPLSNAKDKHRLGMAVNIIQHPAGRKKTIAIRNNYLLVRSDDEKYLLYDTDTLPGSSGAPVLNDDWQLIALHHYGEGDNESDPSDERQSVVNAGVRTSAIYNELSTRAAAMEDNERKTLLIEALSLYAAQPPADHRLQPRPPAPALPAPAQELSRRASASVRDDEAAMDASTDRGTLIIPLQVSIRLAGDARSAAVEAGAQRMSAPDAPARRLKAGPERARLDRDYANRNGFDAGFIDGIAIDLEKIIHPLRAKVAPLLADAGACWLAYQNFSVVVHAEHRLPLLTATNIDGDTYVELSRRRASEPEGETWYADKRIDPEFLVSQAFYDGWSDQFDRGHMTRRVDPTWGTHAERAETDTFHFSNCTPQHYLFNQGFNLWQGLERYVLEKGLKNASGARVSVLQGPVFAPETDLWADNEVMIPARFWKLVFWNGASGRKAVALVADQTDVLASNIGRDAGGVDRRDVDVKKFVVSVRQLENMTGLDLGAFRDIDTARSPLPTPGEAIRLVRRLEDIPLD